MFKKDAINSSYKNFNSMDSFGTKQTKCTPHGDTEPREEDNSSKAIDGTSTTSSEDKPMAKPE